MKTLRAGLCLVAVATFVLIIFTWWHMLKIADQQKQSEQILSALPKILKTTLPEGQWQNWDYQRLPVQRYYLCLPDYHRKQAILKDEKPDSKLYFVAGFPDGLLEEWSKWPQNGRSKELPASVGSPWTD